ncbi:unnamed protein product [Rotaria sp. Silwood2]|nr:unnamed protein product [Rotaria sp. Silwood2]CAF4283154.1 unnamed protein product [Rotaria sp. Silwood2]
MSDDPEPYGSRFPPPPSNSWTCDSCRRLNAATRYQCKACYGYNTYDLCEECIGQSTLIHPGHTFRLIQSSDIRPR